MHHPDPAAWARQYLIDPIEIDCITAIMLKILDGKCKMGAQEKAVTPVLYDVIKARRGLRLGDSAHQLIAAARACPEESMVMAIYEQRLLAETMISRPVMKGFKARLREQGIYRPAGDEGDDPA